MTTDLNRFLGRKVRGLICLLGLLSWFAWSPVLHAAPAKTQVSKQKKVQVSKHKKAQVVAKHRVTKQFTSVKRKAATVRQAKAVKRKAALVRQAYVVKPSVGQMAGLHQASDDLNLKSIRIPCLSQKLLRLCDIAGKGVAFLVPKIADCKELLVLNRKSLPHFVDDGIVVDGVFHRLADTHIFEGTPARVHSDILERLSRSGK